MKSTFIEYGDTKMPVEVPDNATILTPEDLRQDPPKVDPYEATRKALEKPLGMPSLREWQNQARRPLFFALIG